MLKKLLFFLFIFGLLNVSAQNGHIKITDETKNNRLSVFANNESETDYEKHKTKFCKTKIYSGSSRF